MENQLTTKQLFSQQNVRQKFEEMLGKKASSFITSVLQICNSNDYLKDADPMSIFNASAVAATLDLPLNNNLGFAYIVPFNQRQSNGSYKKMAQFQLGYKGFIQLAQRTGLFKTIGATAIYEGQLIEENPLTGFVFDFKQKKSETIVGYASHFSLINGFEKTFYMSIDNLKKHGKRYSQTFKKGQGLWSDDFESMAIKTVIKLLLSKYAPLSIEMQKAVITDQSIINNEEGTDVTYADNEVIPIDKESERVILMIQDATTIEELEQLKPFLKDEHYDWFNEKENQLKTLKQ